MNCTCVLVSKSNLFILQAILHLYNKELQSVLLSIVMCLASQVDFKELFPRQKSNVSFFPDLFYTVPPVAIFVVEKLRRIGKGKIFLTTISVCFTNMTTNFLMGVQH